MRVLLHRIWWEKPMQLLRFAALLFVVVELGLGGWDRSGVVRLVIGLGLLVAIACHSRRAWYVFVFLLSLNLLVAAYIEFSALVFDTKTHDLGATLAGALVIGIELLALASPAVRRWAHVNEPSYLGPG